MSEHTPGPWQVKDGTRIVAPHPLPGAPDAFYAIAGADTEADALLAAAAPDLLDALKRVLTGEVTPGAWAQGRAAIAKAEGTQEQAPLLTAEENDLRLAEELGYPDEHGRFPDDERST